VKGRRGPSAVSLHILPLIVTVLAPSAGVSSPPAASKVVLELDDVVPRGDWDPGYQPPPSVSRYDRLDELTHVVIHHSDFEPPEGPSGILDYHLEVSGFADIGYHFVIAEDGTVYEGRPLALLGAHAGQSKEANRAVVKARNAGKDPRVGRRLDPDWGSVGIVLDGYFGERPPRRAQRDALIKLVAQLRRKLDIPVDHVLTHREVKERLVQRRGRTFVGPLTVCPGDGLQRLVERTWRRGTTPDRPRPRVAAP
jgi:hypothetical protein